jgi:glycine cleavage system H protein
MESEVVEINEELNSKPNLVNESPEDQGWLVRVKYSGDFSALSKQWKSVDSTS